MSRLAAAYEALRRTGIDVNDYRGPVFDAAFDLVTLESGVAGITDTFLEEGRVPAGLRPVLAAPSRLRGTRWTLADGGEVDLAADPGLLEHARRVEEVRGLCRAALGREP